MYVSDYTSLTAFIDENETYHTALHLMNERNQDYLPVTNDQNLVIGILSRHDTDLAAHRFADAPIDAGDMINRFFVTVPEDATISEAAKRMIDNGVESMLVQRKEGGLFGVLTNGDLNRALIDILRADNALTDMNDHAA